MCLIFARKRTYSDFILRCPKNIKSSWNLQIISFLSAPERIKVGNEITALETLVWK